MWWMPKKISAMDSFWSLVDKTSTCWLWIGARRGGRKNQYGNWRGNMAHRVSWVMANGRAVPDGMFICHTCDVPLCVRPDHLFLGTASDNARDMFRKRRSPLSSISMETARAIRSIVASGVRQSEVASSLGLSRPTVCEIVNGRRWKEGDLVRAA